MKETYKPTSSLLDSARKVHTNHKSLQWFPIEKLRLVWTPRAIQRIPKMPNVRAVGPGSRRNQARLATRDPVEWWDFDTIECPGI